MCAGPSRTRKSTSRRARRSRRCSRWCPASTASSPCATAPQPCGSCASGRYDAALLLPNSFNAAFIARRAGIPERWGYRSDFRAVLLSRALAPPPARASGGVLPGSRSSPRLSKRTARTAARGIVPSCARPPPHCCSAAGWDGRGAARGAGAGRGLRRRETVAGGVVRARWPNDCRRTAIAVVLIGGPADRGGRCGVAGASDAGGSGHRSDRPDQPAGARRRSRSVPDAGHQRFGRDAPRRRPRRERGRDVRSDQRARNPSARGRPQHRAHSSGLVPPVHAARMPADARLHAGHHRGAVRDAARGLR